MALHLLLIDKDRNVRLNGALLIVRYPEGDVDVVNTKMKDLDRNLHRALYDEYQCSEVLREGDEFAFRSRVRFECSGVHVLECDRSLV